jgi:hypothetical protein
MAEERADAAARAVLGPAFEVGARGCGVVAFDHAAGKFVALESRCAAAGGAPAPGLAGAPEGRGEAAQLQAFALKEKHLAPWRLQADYSVTAVPVAVCPQS